MNIAISHKIKLLRNQRGFSQDRVANELTMTRPTYTAIENGTRDITCSEAQKLAALYDISVTELISEAASKPAVLVSLAKETARKPPSGMRINVPQKNIKKFKEVLLYVLEKVGAMPHVGETVIYKLLYFIDFDYYEKYEEQLVGATYMKNKFGPTPIEFKKIVARMSELSEIAVVKNKHFQYEQKKYLPLRSPDLSFLSGREIEHINDVLARLAGKNASQLSDYSHDDVPWIATENGHIIEYETVFYRTPKTSVRNYDD
jgi:transcriptional regulator with XRE-family HTH domain